MRRLIKQKRWIKQANFVCVGSIWTWHKVDMHNSDESNETRATRTHNFLRCFFPFVRNLVWFVCYWMLFANAKEKGICPSDLQNAKAENKRRKEKNVFQIQRNDRFSSLFCMNFPFSAIVKQNEFRLCYRLSKTGKMQINVASISIFNSFLFRFEERRKLFWKILTTTTKDSRITWTMRTHFVECRIKRQWMFLSVDGSALKDKNKQNRTNKVEERWNAKRGDERQRR